MTDTQSQQVYRLIYRSRDLIAPEQRKIELGHLFTEARSNNKRQGITGALLLKDDCFVQTLEGPEELVRDLFARIAQDPRHDSVSVVNAGPVPVRVFARWAMARVADADGESDINQVAHTDGISDAAKRGDETGQQKLLLDLMREAARDETAVT